MPRSRSLVALTAALLVSGGSVVLAQPAAAAPTAAVAAKKPAPGPAFTKVMTLDLLGPSIEAPAPGVVYALGVKNGGETLERIVGGKATDVISANAYMPFMTSAGGALFLYMRDYQQSGTLYSVSGTTATPMPITLPAGLDHFQAMSMAADSATSLWLTGYGYGPTDPTTGAQPVTKDLVLHWDGTTWTAAPSYQKNANNTTTFAKDGQVFVQWTFSSRFDGYGTGVVRGDGSSWTTAPGTMENVWTMKSANDYTMWGYQRTTDSTGAVSVTPACSHVVDNVATPCPAPASAAYDAALLANGSTVLSTGGNDSFYYVAQDGAVPTPLAAPAGETSATYVAAEPSSSVVWAVTSHYDYSPAVNNYVYGLSRIDLAATPTKGKKH